MRNMTPLKLEESRIRKGEMASTSDYGMAGAFTIMGPKGEYLCIVSSGVDRTYGWEHVSISTKRRIPNWEEMCFVKDLFWYDNEAVMQLHPPKADYVNYEPNCLHLWRPLNRDIPLPPSILVGPRTALDKDASE
jgi:hypothetical protein